MDARRRRLIAQAHLAAKQAGCVDEEDRRAVQRIVTGKSSCLDMTVAELVRLIDHWGKLGAQVRASAPEAAQAPGMVTRWQLATIERLAWEMGWDDGLEDARLVAFLRRTARVDAARWLTREAASSVISGLSRWKRQRAKREVSA
ncbi:regulatory protein GemA [Pelomicrobium methylotrophicum]|nr:regulatory protein GemA [Pelomicrobium methylotrophicum]